MHFLKKIITISFVWLSLAFVPAVLAQTATDRFEVEAIIVDGNERVTDATIEAYLPIKIGDKIDLQALDQAISSLFATNLFENVSISKRIQILII